MVIEKKNYIVEYDESNSYMYDVCNYLDAKMDSIMNFFELDNLKYKRKIVIYNDLEKYKNHIEQFFEYQDYMCADTNDGNINMLSLEAAHKTKEHKNMTLDFLKSVITHEFVHICHIDSEIDNSVENVWFMEALATNLGNPEYRNEITFDESDKEILDFHNLTDKYDIAYTIGKYMLNNYSHEKILEYIRYPKKVLNDSSIIFDEVREYSKKVGK